MPRSLWRHMRMGLLKYSQNLAQEPNPSISVFSYPFYVAKPEYKNRKYGRRSYWFFVSPANIPLWSPYSRVKEYLLTTIVQNPFVSKTLLMICSSLVQNFVANVLFDFGEHFLYTIVHLCLLYNSSANAIVCRRCE